MHGQKILSQLQIAWFIALRGIRSSLIGFGLYGAIFTGSVIAVLAIGINIGAFKENGILIASNPLNFPLYIVMVLSAVYLSITASLSVSRERDKGTLEVLFYGPVEANSFIFGKYLEQIGIYLLMLVIYGLEFIGFGMATHFGFYGNAMVAMVLSIVPISGIIVFGILLSVITKKVRTSTLYLITLLFLFLMIQFGDAVINGINLENLPPALVYLKSFLSFSANVLSWVSPFSYLSREWTALQVYDASESIVITLESFLYSGIVLALAIWRFKAKGVKA